eukprot:TRINITY_DN79219_c0_g1_i1.p1 TRINITY_DN79219_c0_g1~~TRINITY_DN79219_c0_g1_i1.p1  ORF type:complete len:169 (+),score=15.08 TRINITY_DN79219_c0_g1_i1:67-573(+)
MNMQILLILSFAAVAWAGGCSPTPQKGDLQVGQTYTFPHLFSEQWSGVWCINATKPPTGMSAVLIEIVGWENPFSVHYADRVCGIAIGTNNATNKLTPLQVVCGFQPGSLIHFGVGCNAPFPPQVIQFGIDPQTCIFQDSNQECNATKNAVREASLTFSLSWSKSVVC